MGTRRSRSGIAQLLRADLQPSAVDDELVARLAAIARHTAPVDGRAVRARRRVSAVVVSMATAVVGGVLGVADAIGLVPAVPHLVPSAACSVPAGPPPPSPSTAAPTKPAGTGRSWADHHRATTATAAARARARAATASARRAVQARVEVQLGAARKTIHEAVRRVCGRRR